MSAPIETVEPDVAAELEAEQGPFNSFGRRVGPLTEDEIKGVLQREIEDSLGGLGSEISEQRRRAIRMYYSRPFGNEQEGRSKVQLDDVRDTIEWIMPQLVRMFLGSSEIVRFDPNTPEQEDHAQEATDYVNQVVLPRIKFFLTAYNWMKTGLLEKNGLTKVFVESRFEPKVEEYVGLTEMEVTLLLENDEYEVLEATEREEPLEQPGPDGQPVQQALFDITVRVQHERTNIGVDGVPPEEFLIARRAIFLDDTCPFAAHRKKMLASDLIAMGFDPDYVYNLPSDDTPEYSQGRTERLSEDETFPITTAERADPASREFWTTECHIRMDEDGDGYAELRRILIVGEQSIHILEDEEEEFNPFSSLNPIPMPHKFFGLSVADLVMDLQVIRSTLLRQMLDNLYNINNQRHVVIEDMVEIDDLITSRPGGVVRALTLDAIKPLETGQLGPMALGMLEFLETVRENRTGVTRYNQGLDASSLNQTASGINSIMNAAQARIETIARIYAETGFKDLFSKMLRLLVTGGMKKEMVKLNGKWTEVDPSRWSADMRVSVNVGLGVGQAAERVQNITLITQMQQTLKEVGLAPLMVKPKHVFNSFKKMTDAMGFEATELFFEDPGDQEAPEPPPDPKVLEAERRSKKDDADVELEKTKLQLETLEQQQEMSLKQEELASRERLALKKIESDERIALRKCDLETEKIAVAKANPRKEPSDG